MNVAEILSISAFIYPDVRVITAAVKPADEPNRCVVE